MTTKTLPRLLLSAALFGASSLSLAAGGAKAVTVCSSFPVCAPAPDPVSVTLGDKTMTVTDPAAGPTVGAGNVVLTNPGITPLGDVHAVEVDFVDELSDTTPGIFEYRLKIDPSSPNIYSKAQLSWADALGFPVSSVTKSIYSDSLFANLIGSTSTNGGIIDILALAPGTTDIWVRDNYTSGGALDYIRNDFAQVPGPLPLLGAGTAFGLSRRLRRRCKARLSLG
jgi:hypothetical protein